MDERRPENEELEARGTGAERPSAGAANTPMFERDRGLATPGSEGGRPPSHRELEQGELQGERGDDSMRGIAPAGSTTGGDVQERAGEFAERANERAGEAMDRMSEQAEQQKRRAASGIEGASRRLHEQAERRAEGGEGLRGAAGRAAHRVADRGEEFADYLRDTDVDDLRGALERQVREHPLQTLLVAVAAGWLIGKILR